MQYSNKNYECHIDQELADTTA